MVASSSLDRLLFDTGRQVLGGKTGPYVGMPIGVKHAADEEGGKQEPDALTEPAKCHDRATEIHLGEDHERLPRCTLPAKRYVCP